MMKRSVSGLAAAVVRAVVVRAVVVTVVAAVGAGCAGTDGTPRAESTSSPGADSSTTSTTSITQGAPRTPTGQPIGTATMKVDGSGPATIRYQINGAAEQVEADATLPWEMQYPVYNEVQSSVSADGGDTELTCSIIMDGMLAAFTTEARPTCSFAYY